MAVNNAAPRLPSHLAWSATLAPLIAVCEAILPNKPFTVSGHLTRPSELWAEDDGGLPLIFRPKELSTFFGAFSSRSDKRGVVLTVT